MNAPVESYSGDGKRTVQNLDEFMDGKQKLVGGFKRFFIFIPTWENDPI